MTLLKNRVFIDTETDGVRRGRQVWDVGMVCYDADGNRTTHSMLVEDVDLSHAEAAALAIGNFQQRHPKAGGEPERGTIVLPEREVARIVFEATYSTVIAGIVVNFDSEALDDLLRRNGLCWTAWHHMVDVESRAFGAIETHALYVPEVAEAHADLLTAAAEGRWKTEDIVAAYGLPELDSRKRHTGLGDAVLAEMIYRATVIDKVVPVPGVTWQPTPEISAYLASPWQADKDDADLAEDTALAMV